MSEPDEQEKTRYARQQEKLHQQERHGVIVQKLSRPIVDQWEDKFLELREKGTPPPCVAAGYPSEWTDWDIEPEDREPQDRKMPTAHRAEEMCKGCPLMDNDLCYRYALATDKKHGIWGGRRLHNGFVVSDGRDSPDRPNRERHAG